MCSCTLYCTRVYHNALYTTVLSVLRCSVLYCTVPFWRRIMICAAQRLNMLKTSQALPDGTGTPSTSPEKILFFAHRTTTVALARRTPVPCDERDTWYPAATLAPKSVKHVSDGRALVQQVISASVVASRNTWKKTGSGPENMSDVDSYRYRYHCVAETYLP